MKYVVFLGDGMADYSCPELSGKTPLEAADKQNMDFLSKNGTLGMVKTIDDSLAPGSDVANLSVLGYDPKIYYTGRSSLEALSMNVSLLDTDVTFRANLVTLSPESDFCEKTLLDYSSDEIDTKDAHILINDFKNELSNEPVVLYGGISYRNLLVMKNGSVNVALTPPHDITGKKITGHLPSGDNAELLLSIMKKSYDFLSAHPLNKKRVSEGKNPANCLWFWGEAKKPKLDSFYEKRGLKASMISAVDLLRGIGKGAGMNVVLVEGATGNINTNFDGKCAALIDELKNGSDFVYVHVEAPDECGHRQEIENKVRAIELIDKKIIGPTLEYLNASGEPYRVLLLPDHPTPLKLKTHVKDPVPFVLYKKGQEVGSKLCYSEKNGLSTGIFINSGCELMERFLQKDII